MDWVDPEDPIVIAETQLLGAANAIEAAARKLEQLQPRKAVKVSTRCQHCSCRNRGVIALMKHITKQALKLIKLSYISIVTFQNLLLFSSFYIL